jgi:hypothetical protein
VARYYLDGLEAVLQGMQEPNKLSYHYHLPFDEQFKQWEDYGNGIPEEMKNDPLIRSSFFWALRHGDQATKLQVIHALGMIGDYEVQQALQLFIDEPGEESTLVKAAQVVLHDLQRAEHHELDAKVPQTLTPETLKSLRKVGKADVAANHAETGATSHWQVVVDRALQMSEARAELQHEMERIWTDYVSRVCPDLSGSKQIEGWAAGLEYLASKNRSRPVTYQSIAERYGISASTVSKYARQLNQICSAAPPNH